MKMNLLKQLKNIAHESWLDQASCNSTDPEVFFPLQGESTKRAKGVCDGCPVESECLEWALSANERFGVWGGQSEQEREKTRKKRLRQGIA